MVESAKQVRLKDHQNNVEDLEFEEVTIFYNLLFDLGDPINPTKAARSLLKHEFSLSAANYYDNDIDIADRFEDLFKLCSKAKEVDMFIDVLKKCNYAEKIKHVIKNPKIASNLLYEIIKIKINGSETTGIIDEDRPKKLEDILKLVDDSMINIQWVLALEHDIDRELLVPEYIKEIPFVRVSLQPFFVLIDNEKMGIDAEVLIHRTGIAILRFYIIFESKKTLDDIINIRASSTFIEHYEIAQELIDFMTAPIRPPSESRYSSGINWVKYVTSEDNKESLADVFYLYQNAIISVLLNKKPMKPDEPRGSRRSEAWLAYPVIFIGNIIPSINNYETLKEKYPKELAGLILRFPGWQSLKESAVKNAIDSDLALTENYSLFINPGYSLIIYYKSLRDKLVERSKGKFPSPEWLSEYLKSSIIIDILLIQRWILYTLNDKAKNISLGLKSLVKIKRDILLGMEEYNGILLMHGSAQDIVNQIKVNMGTVSLYERLKQKTEILGELINIEESNKRARLDLLLKTTALFATAFFGLVGSWRIVEIITGWDELASTAPGEWEFVLVGIIDFVKNHQIGVSIFLYSIPIIVLLIIIISGMKSDKREPIINADQSISAKNSGFKSPIKVRIVHKK